MGSFRMAVSVASEQMHLVTYFGVLISLLQTHCWAFFGPTPQSSLASQFTPWNGRMSDRT
ncbi:MAG: hypothetical protein KGQ60_01515 [Planctomycetes bacterium]|nr:hypothetical protein [Planctomycetota bacterium]